MLRRLVLLSIALVVTMGIGVPSALAWSNGPEQDGVQGNGFGTHDWVLDEAMSIAGTDAAWLDRTIAMEATDDPDTYQTNSAYHLFRDIGDGRGAPSKVAELYYQAVKAYQAGDIATASYDVGVLSHYYADVLQPFHTSYDALRYDALHGEYELKVDAYHRAPGNVSDWITPVGAKPITDIRQRLISAGYYSRSQYPYLVTAYSKSRSIEDYTVKTVTKKVLSRAANDLADVLRSIPASAGVSPAPTAMVSTMYKYYPGQNSKVAAYAKCTDASGKPMEAVAVVFRFTLPTGDRAATIYTDKNGLATYWLNTGTAPLMRRTTVVTTANSGGVVKTSSSWFMATKPLAAGSAGIKTTVSNHFPKRSTTVYATTLIRDTSGKAIVGLPVTFSWKFRTGTVYYKVVTDAKGIAHCRRNIGGATRGYRVYVKAQTMAGGISRSSTATFVPQ